MSCPPRHGHASFRNPSAEYRAWQNMRSRCNNPNNPEYKRYGAKGIRVCLEWDNRRGFDSFLMHMGLRPSNNHSVDRIDALGNYEPGNVRWATAAEQTRNRAATKLTETDVQFIKHWLAIGCRPTDIGPAFGVKKHTISGIKHGTRWGDVQ